MKGLLVKKISIILFTLIGTFNLAAQEITVKEIRELNGDITATKYGRTDNTGKKCAVIKVALPSFDNFSFAPSVGETVYKSGEYIVYVSEGITSLSVMRNNTVACVIDFKKNNLEIMSKHTYMAALNVEQIREAVFRIQPTDAKLTVNGEEVKLDANGAAKYICKPDIMYNYTIQADNYESFEDGFMLDEDEGFLEPINISLEPKMSKVTFTGNVEEVEVIVNNESYGMVGNGDCIQLPYGINNIRILADKYEEWNQKTDIDKESFQISFDMKKANDVSKKLRPRSSLYIGSGFIFDFNSEMNMEKQNLAGYPIRVGVDIEKFITRWFTVRSGLEFMALMGDELKVNDSSPLSINVPIIFSLNAPLGKLNRHHFSVGVGPVLGYVFLDEGESGDTEKKDEFDILGGGRMEARFTINHFILSAGLDYQYYIKRYIGEKGFLVPSLTIGYKL